MSLLSCRPSYDGKSKNKGICVLERSGFTVRLFVCCGKGQQWPRTVRFSSWWRMWRCRSCLPWRCQKILGSWGPKCQAHLNGGSVENAKISTCPREVLVIMKISPTMECKLQGSNLQMNIGTVLQTFSLSDINHAMQNLSLCFAENCIPVTDHFQMGKMLLIFCKWNKLRLCAATIWMKKGAEQISGEEGKRGGITSQGKNPVCLS